VRPLEAKAAPRLEAKAVRPLAGRQGRPLAGKQARQLEAKAADWVGTVDRPKPSTVSTAEYWSSA